MRNFLVAGSVAAAVLFCGTPDPAAAVQAEESVDPLESRIPVDGASLYTRVVGEGRPVIVLHGGPDFDHRYLLPELDRFRDRFRLVYFDQRGRGLSAENVRPEDVTLASELDDIDRVRKHYSLDAPVMLGHSWGAVLALEYALRHPTRVSHLILMNPSPASTRDLALLQKAYRKQLGADMDRQREIVEGEAYRAADPEAVAARYRIHFRPALKRHADYERLMARMEATFVEQGNEGILKARAVEERLMDETWNLEDYDLLPELRTLELPTLVIAGEDDFIPVEVAEHIAGSIPGAKLVTIEDCGHFSYFECAGEVRNALESFFGHR